MKKLNLLLALPLVYLMGACDQRTEQAVTVEDDTNDQVEQHDDRPGVERGGIWVYPMEHGQSFTGARLQMNRPEEGATVAAGNVTFSWEVSNFNLGELTEDRHERGLADSEHGQHIHLIVNNEHYVALYEPNHQMRLEAGEYVALSFLSRSYHESLKNNAAYKIRRFRVGQGGQPLEFNDNGEHLFYSRPKDSYSGQEAERIMLDFYLVNTDLSDNGNRVRATINGNEFILNDWRPYAVEGLPDGQATFRLELIDGDGNIVPGPFNTVERTITVNRQGTAPTGHGH